MKKSTKGLHDDWFEEAAALPREDEPVETKNRRAKWLRRSIVAAALTGLISFPLWILSMATQQEVEAPEAPEMHSAGKTVAITSVEEWLDREPAPVPEGHLQSWDSFVKTPFPALSEDEVEQGAEGPGYQLEVHSLTVIDGQDRDYTVDVQVVVTENAGAHVVGTPSLIPNTPSAGQFSPDEVWPGFHIGAQVPGPVTTAINAWLAAYTSGNPDDLRQAIGDPDGGNTYVPLVGVSSASAEVVQAARFMTEGDDGDLVEDDRMLVRISTTIQWDGQVAATDGTSDSPTISYDLLIHDVDTAAPKVVAWGGPGTGHTLTPYGNAITGREDLTGDLNEDQNEDGATPTDQPMSEDERQTEDTGQTDEATNAGDD
jgi:hypothetical protein